MTQKVIVAVVCSITAQIVGFFMAFGVGLMGVPATTDENIRATIGSLLFWGGPFVAILYIFSQHSHSRKIAARGSKSARTSASPIDKKTRIVMIVGVVVILAAVPAALFGEFISAKWADWRSEVAKQEQIRENEAWQQNQRKTVCITEDNVTYDFEFAGIYEDYETAAYALRDNAPQAVRNQAIDIITNRISPTYEACQEEQITPLAEREQLRATFNDFIQLAAPYVQQ